MLVSPEPVAGAGGLPCPRVLVLGHAEEGQGDVPPPVLATGVPGASVDQPALGDNYQHPPKHRHLPCTWVKVRWLVFLATCTTGSPAWLVQLFITSGKGLLEAGQVPSSRAAASRWPNRWSSVAALRQGAR